MIQLPGTYIGDAEGYMGLLTSYLKLTQFVRRAEAGDGLAAWMAFAELHRLCAEIPGDHEYRGLLARVEPLIAAFAAGIVQAATHPQEAGARAALTELRKACGISGQSSSRKMQQARNARERGERAALGALNREVARAIVEKDEPRLPTERSTWVRIAAAAAGVDERTARDYDLPPVLEKPEPEPEPEPTQRRAKRRPTPKKPKKWRRDL